jgi:hypothetical protein
VLVTIAAWLLIATAARAVTSAPVDAGDSVASVPRDHGQMVRRVDALLAELWDAEGVAPAALANDNEFLRRAYLDLVGVIPRVSEVRAFLADDRPDKRALLVDQLLSSPRHATHMATTWRNRILPVGVDPTHDREALGLQKWLRTRFAKNLRYDNIVGGLLLTTGGDELGPALYFQANDLAPEKIASSAAELFLGVHLQCAMCHDHPYADWSQRDFWGLAAFFARVQAPAGRGMQQVNYRLVDADRGEVRIPESDEIVAPKYPGGEPATDDAWQTRRVQLTTWMASRDNRYFARAGVNWAWSHLFGQGLVASLDDVDDEDQSIQSRLLDELADDFVDSGFDLQQLWRVLANTRAYQLSSRHEQLESVPAESFARMLAKPFTPEQMYDSFLVLSPREPQVRGPGGTMAFGLDDDPARIEFVRRMRPPPGSATEFRAGTLQALMLMNGPTMASVTAPDLSNLLGALAAPFMDAPAQVEAMFLATLCRSPDADELEKCVSMLRQSASATPQDRTQARSDILWALLNSTEFAFNR